jgi:hypothetical protein
MRLEVVDLKPKPQLKATLQSDGNLSFFQQTIKDLNIQTGMHVLLLIDKDEKDPLIFYLQFVPKATDNTLRVNGAGPRRYLNTESFFTSKLRLPFTQKSYRFDIEPIEFQGKALLKLKGRVVVFKKVLRTF